MPNLTSLGKVVAGRDEELERRPRICGNGTPRWAD
jgi:hypothetical protein